MKTLTTQPSRQVKVQCGNIPDTLVPEIYLLAVIHFKCVAVLFRLSSKGITLRGHPEEYGHALDGGCHDCITLRGLRKLQAPAVPLLRLEFFFLHKKKVFCANMVLQISTVQYSTVKYSTVQYSTVQYSKVQ